MSGWVRVVLVGVAVLACGVMAIAGERTAGNIRLDSESFNAAGASFASAPGIELGWTIGQHGLHGWCSDDSQTAFGLQGGIWSEAEEEVEKFPGTVFMFR